MSFGIVDQFSMDYASFGHQKPQVTFVATHPIASHASTEGTFGRGIITHHRGPHAGKAKLNLGNGVQTLGRQKSLSRGKFKNQVLTSKEILLTRLVRYSDVSEHHSHICVSTQTTAYQTKLVNY